MREFFHGVLQSSHNVNSVKSCCNMKGKDERNNVVVLNAAVSLIVLQSLSRVPTVTDGT